MARKTMRRAGAWIGLGAFTAGAGAVVGFGIWLLLDVAYWLLDLVWKNGVDALGIAWLPVVVCAVGGVCIGLWNKRFHCAPKPFNEVISDVKRTGGYHLGRVAPSAVAFLLPIAFGGSVGPEAGLMGLIAAGCTWVGERMRTMGVRLGVMHEGEDFSKAAKRTLYVVGAAGGVAGVVAVIALVGSGMSIPRFEAVAFGLEPLLWAVPLALGGYALGLLYLAAVRGAQALHERFDRHVVLMPTLVGLALGTAAVFLPYVLFPGSQQASELMGAWAGMSAVALLLTGLVKTVFIALCLNLGWSGGPYFPLIFCGISFGYGVSAATGLDPVLCVTAITAALMAAFSRQPGAAVIISLLVFPPTSIPVLAVAIAVGLLVPLPKAIAPTKLAPPTPNTPPSGGSTGARRGRRPR